MSPPTSPSEGTFEAARLQARTYAVCALCIVTSAVFFLTGVAPLPVLLYFPIGRRFGFTPHPTELAMDFYGRSLLALLAGVAAAILGYAVLRVVGVKTPRKNRLLLLTGYAATALLLAAGLFAYQLSVRVPTPLPLPHVEAPGQTPPTSHLAPPE